MKLRFLAIFLGVFFLLNFANAGVFSTADKVSTNITPLAGTYRGIIPVSRDPFSMGEMTLTISAKIISGRFVGPNGDSYITLPAPTSADYRLMKPRQIRKYIRSDLNARDFLGIQGKTGAPIIIFLNETEPSEDRPTLFFFSEAFLREFDTPAMLFSPEQIERGYYSSNIEEIETHFSQEPDPVTLYHFDPCEQLLEED